MTDKDPERSCVRKTAFKDFMSAKVACVRFCAKMNDWDMEPYYCEFCYHWHYGHRIGMHKRKAIRASKGTEKPGL